MSGSRVQAVSYAPPDDLADVVQRLWVGRWDLEGQEPHLTQLIADPAVNLVFESTGARLVGVWTELWTRELTGRGLVRGIKLKPGAAMAFLPDEARSYSNRKMPLSDVLPGVSQVFEAAVDFGDDRAAVASIFEWLRPLRRRAAGIAEAVALMQFIHDSQVTRVDALAKHASLSVRQLQRLFRHHVGATPKWVIRWSRLQEVAVRVEAGQAEDLADLAYDLGYSDQAHLARDFRSATGRTLRGFESDLHR
ncbi:MAG: helix-turn-helix domain-containing protein [Myxococcota bacterium]